MHEHTLTHTVAQSWRYYRARHTHVSLLTSCCLATSQLAWLWQAEVSALNHSALWGTVRDCVLHHPQSLLLKQPQSTWWDRSSQLIQGRLCNTWGYETALLPPPRLNCFQCIVSCVINCPSKTRCTEYLDYVSGAFSRPLQTSEHFSVGEAHYAHLRVWN